MNAITEELTLADELPAQPRTELAKAQPVAAPATYGVSAHSPAGMMMAAMNQGASLEQVEKMMDLQDRWERREAEKAYNVAFSAFKAEAVRIIKSRSVTDGPLKGKSYAELHTVVDAVTPALSRHGLSASWKLTRDEKDWLEVTCTLKHVGGHSESVSMGGPPDAGGAKNAIQARASAKTYLERYTLKAICGVAEGGDDTDGSGPGDAGPNKFTLDWIEYVQSLSADRDQMTKAIREGRKAFNDARDLGGLRAFNAAVGAL